MTYRLTVILWASFLIQSCVSNENSSIQRDRITGRYVREYSFKVVNPKSGEPIGCATIRDTIFINHADKGYAVTNSKWRLNDYGTQAWQSLQHSDNRPTPEYEATFRANDSTLVAESYPTIYLDGLHSIIYKGKKGSNPYLRVR